ncbi:MAG: hypothetical protein KAV87_28450 [Desulfobacteraceae bacterium]|nr:hypothetical protein [Desulfobacteraceae bacterium]
MKRQSTDPIPDLLCHSHLVVLDFPIILLIGGGLRLPVLHRFCLEEDILGDFVGILLILPFQFLQVAFPLSAIRANSARRWMEDTGLKTGQISEVRGFSFTKPKIAADPGDSRNRRIAIIVVNDYSGLGYLDKNVILNDEDIEGDQPQHADEISSESIATKENQVEPLATTEEE